MARALKSSKKVKQVKPKKSKALKEVAEGTIRIDATTLEPFSKTKRSWKKIKREFPELYTVVSLYKAAGNFDLLVDTKNPRFLKGQLSPEGREQGARIVLLPTGEKLEKAFSLFAPHLRIHDQDSHDHWDVLYQNKGGTWSYVYTLAKREKHRVRKYKKVDHFARKYHVLHESVGKALLDPKDEMAVPMYTLLHTFMRIGNEVYYKAHGHKGLSTLMKGDVMVKGNTVRFSFLGKDGVPQSLVHEFPPVYVKRLKKLFVNKKDNDYVFLSSGHVLRERDFQKAFVKYCGEVFYPHIVRSYHATSRVQKALEGGHSFSREAMQHLFLSIAHDLGHKKYDAKSGEWKDHYAVTVSSYVQPELLLELQERVK